MKLRLHENSVRIRLRQPEVERLGSGGCVENATLLGPGPTARFECRVISGAVAEITSDLADGVLTVFLPAAAAAAWSQGEDVGLYAETTWGLSIAVEKDFRCIEPRATEDETGAFERPLGGPPHPCSVDSNWSSNGA
jgi:hypothetical protein